MVGFYNPAFPTGQPGITGSGSFTYKAPGSPAVGLRTTYAGFDNFSNRYSGSPILSGGFLATNSNRGAVQSYFGTSTVTFDGASLSSQLAANNSFRPTANRTLQLYNDVALGAGGGFTHGTYGAADQGLEFVQGVSGTGARTGTAGTDWGLANFSGALDITATSGTPDLSASNLDSAVAGTTYRLFDFSATPTGNFASLTPLGGSYSGITRSGPAGASAAGCDHRGSWPARV